MKVTTETVATREVELTIEPEVAFMEKAMQIAARRISRVRSVPGFRPGKAPYALAERTYGRETILNEALREHSEGFFTQAIGEAHVDPYEARPLEVVSTDPVLLKVRIPLMPLTKLGDYRALHIDPEPPVSLDESEVDKEIALMRRRHAEYQPVERPVAMGDQIVATLKGRSDDKDLVVDRKSSTMTIEADMTPPGFAEAVVGMIAGESRQFTLAYPADYDDEHLAGKTVDFDVALETVRQVNLPALDDEFAKTAGDFATVAEMREQLGQRIKNRLETQAKNREQSRAVEALVAVSSVEYPAAAVETELNGIIETRKAQLRQLGLDLAGYLKIVNKSEEQMREEARPEAERRLISQTVIHEFAMAEKLKVESDELEAQLDRMAAAYGEHAAEARKQLAQGNARLSVYIELLQDQALRYLTDLLTGRVQPTEAKPAEEQAAAAEPAADPAVDETKEQ